MKRTSGALAVGSAAFAYVVAVTQRSSMGAASLLAAERFHTNAEQLASLAVLQIFIYAAMQVPIGFLLDRFGSRALLIFGALAMASGQIVVSFSGTLSQAIVGRILVGFGDAFTFISLIRIINGWYEGRRASQLQQWLGNFGQLGQVLSAVPFSLLLGVAGWQSAFLGISSASLLAAFLLLVAARNERSPSSDPPAKLNLANIKRQFAESLSHPATRFAFWIHFSTQSAATVFVLLWGFPFLERGEGLAKPVASALISSMVFIGFATGAFAGWLCGAHPKLRFRLVVSVVSALMAIWIIVLLWPGVAPLWLMMLLVFVLGGAAPASMIAFDYSKAYTPMYRLGSANGIVNIGGFLATFVTMFLIGVALDVIHAVRFSSASVGSSVGLYDLSAFRIAMWIQVVVILVGLIGLRFEHRKLAKLHPDEPAVIA